MWQLVIVFRDAPQLLSQSPTKRLEYTANEFVVNSHFYIIRGARPWPVSHLVTDGYRILARSCCLKYSNPDIV